MTDKVGGSVGAGVSANEIGCGKRGATQSSCAFRETDLGVGETIEKFVGWSADVAGLAGEVRCGKKRSILRNCPDPISSELVWVDTMHPGTLSSAFFVVALLSV